MEHRASLSHGRHELAVVDREIRKLIQAIPELLHPRMADVYCEKVRSLCSALESEESRTSAADAIRALVEAILLEPDGDSLKITLKGDLAGMLSAARPPSHASLSRSRASASFAGAFGGGEDSKRSPLRSEQVVLSDTFSHIYPTLPSLCDALCALAEGKWPQSVVFLLEPQELELSFRSEENQRCIVSVVRFRDRRRDSESGEVVFG